MECIVELSQMNCSIDLNAAINCVTAAAVFAGLLIAGIFYAMLVAWLKKRRYDEGYTAMLVVIGVAWTLAGVAILDFNHALLTAGAFVCSGTPMIIGSWWEHVQMRRKSQEDLQKITEEHMAQFNPSQEQKG